MDINKAKKPIHIRCPYCKRDLQYNGASIKSQKEGLVNRINVLEAKRKAAKNEAIKRDIDKKLKETHFRLKLLSEDVHMLSQLSEIETLKIFKRNVRQYIDREVYERLCVEAEEEYLEENTFNYYDLAIQHYNNFDGA
jgi:hypothetical protein